MEDSDYVAMGYLGEGMTLRKIVNLEYVDMHVLLSDS